MATGNEKLRGAISGSTVSGKVSDTIYYTDAYNIAVAHGFRGTIDEWLESLKGEPGAVQTVNGFAPDENGNVEIKIPEGGGTVTDEQLAEAVNDALAQAKASGEFDGKDGFSPIAKVTQTDDGAVITITDKNGTTEAVIKNGKDSGMGENGVVLTDDATGQNYKIFVSDGKLTMDLLESGVGAAELTLAGQTTGKKYKIYVSSGKLTMEEV